MRLLLLLLILASCKPSKSIKPLVTEDLRYSGYYWHLNDSLQKFEFYLDRYIDINKNGHFELMRHDTWRGKPTYYCGEISDTFRRQIDSAFNNIKYKRDYMPTPGELDYDGLTYCINYKKQDYSDNFIRFIPNDCPFQLTLLASLFDTLVKEDSLKPIEAFDINSYSQELQGFDTGLSPLPILIKFKIPKIGE